MYMYRAEEIVQEVESRGDTWDAYDLGRWAHACGADREQNPYRIGMPATYWNADVGAWDKGWDAEEQRSKN